MRTIKTFEYKDTAWKVSKCGVISGPYLDTFHAVRVAAVKVTRK